MCANVGRIDQQHNTIYIMPTFKPVVSAHQKRTDGSFNIKIRITHKRVSRWIPTNLTAYSYDLTRSLNLKNKDLEWKCNDLIRQMRAALSDVPTFVLEEQDVDWVVQRIKDKMSGKTFNLDFFTFAEEYLSIAKIPATQRNYHSALNSFKEYLGKEAIDINDITHAMVLGFKEWVDTTPKRSRVGKKRQEAQEDATPKRPKLPGGGSSSNQIMKLAHIYNKAKDKYNDEDAGLFLIPRNPFKNVPLSFPPSQTGQKALGQELMQRIISAEATGSDRIALDTFILSFAMMGMNLCDLYASAPPKNGVVRYNRSKTRNRRADHAEMEVIVPREVAVVCSRLCSDDGPYWLAELHRRSPSAENTTSYINKLLKHWADKEGLPPFTFYAARKTWATLARRAGVEKATIDECLVHIGDLKMADIYIEKDYALINEANRKVMALFDWPMME